MKYKKYLTRRPYHAQPPVALSALWRKRYAYALRDLDNTMGAMKLACEYYQRVNTKP